MLVISLGPKTSVLLGFLISYLSLLTIFLGRDGLSTKGESQDDGSGLDEELHGLLDNEVL
jgi:hypothetical protein